MEEKILVAMEKAKAPWWVYILSFLAIVVIGLLKAKNSLTKMNRKLTEHRQKRATDKKEVAKTEERAKVAEAHAASLQEKIDAIKSEEVALQIREKDARARIRAATSFSDLQS